MYIKISAVDTIWSCLGKCELSASLAERTNIYTDNRGIKSLSAGVILRLTEFTHSFAMSSKKPNECSHFNTAVHMRFLSVSHRHQVLQCLAILVSLSWSGRQDGLEADQCIRLGVSLIQIKSSAWSRGVTMGLTVGFRIPLFQGTYSLAQSWCQHCEGPLAVPSRCLQSSQSSLYRLDIEAPAWLSSSRMNFLTQERAHISSDGCALKQSFVMCKGTFFSHPVTLSPWPHLPTTAVQLLVNLLTK